ncbi:hypothetical protein LAZ67_19001709 [Cordylochernes scorpioides]|uniref:Uncharacterized protein n=1 Tax=Cordylochernes scorpioides TaxID=51811 RepID=A0ABY6LKS9_9ARAC|nr:hypothetical protein LAZ67_19001709 [Cordylochernes scorpioides]
MWPERSMFRLDEQSVENEPLFHKLKMLLPFLHIKLGLRKNFVKALKKDSNAVKYLMTKFPKISCAKITEGIFIGLINDEEFIATLKEDLIFDVVKHFFGNNKSPNYAKIVENLISKFHKLECISNIKFHFMDSHLTFSPDNLSAESEEQGGRFHQDIKIIEQRYNGLWNQHMVADYYWNLMRDDKQNIIDFTEKIFKSMNIIFVLLPKYYCIFMNNVY